MSCLGNSLRDVLKLELLSQGLAGRLGELVSTAQHRAGDDHHLAAVLVVESVLALAGEDVGSNVGDVLLGCVSDACLYLPRNPGETYSKCHGRKLVVLANGERQQTLGLGLLRVKEEVLGVESSAGEYVSSSLID